MKTIRIKFEYEDIKYNLKVKLTKPCKLSKELEHSEDESYWSVTDYTECGEKYWTLSYVTEQFVFEVKFKRNSFDPCYPYVIVWHNERYDGHDCGILDDVDAEIEC